MNLKPFKRVASVAVAALVLSASCSNDNKDHSYERDVAQAQLFIDYSNYTISDLKWSNSRGYEVATFDAATKSQPTEITVWYLVQGDTAQRQLDRTDLGTSIPSVIESVFEGTKYSDTANWVVDEIELDNNYNGESIASKYEMELNSVGVTPALEAELIFDASSGELLFTKEEAEDDSDDSDSFVVNSQLNAAVVALYPNATILDAEIENDVIEVDVLAVVDGVDSEIELLFNTSYELVGEQVESQYTWATLPTDYAAVTNWFTTNTQYPTPLDSTVVEVESEVSAEGTLYEVSFDYTSDGTSYEGDFLLNDQYEIVDGGVEVDD